MQKHPGAVLIFGGVGTRGSIADVRNYQVRQYGAIFSEGNQGAFVSHSMVKGMISCLDGTKILFWKPNQSAHVEGRSPSGSS